MADQKKAEPRIVAAVGTAASSKEPRAAKLIEDAMGAAVQKAIDEGVSVNDTEKLRKVMQDARADAKARIAQAEAQPAVDTSLKAGETGDPKTVDRK